MGMIYIEAVYKENGLMQVNLETLLVLYVYQICDTTHVNLNIVYKESIDQPVFTVDLSQVCYDVINISKVPSIAYYSIWPIIIVNSVVISGLCSVSRQIIKCSGSNKLKNLLGFKGACLMACNESSIWTKFCEVDMIKTVKDVIGFAGNYIKNNTLDLPLNVTKFEYHMQQPVRMHNIYKFAREKNLDKSITSSIPLNELNLSHKYGEGSFMTLADVLLYPCFKILFHVFNLDLIKNALPLTVAWFENMQQVELPPLNFDIPQLSVNLYENYKINHGDVLKQSLYTSDPNRYKPQKRIFTKQLDIDKSLSTIEDLNIMEFNEYHPFGFDVDFDWAVVPFEANPEGGALPEKRANRKCQQLENLAKAVLKITKNQKYKIVDFCSGSGHLGILLATLLPNCEIILVENKERSLLRAIERIKKLNLSNVNLLQCNLDYFDAKFDVGVSLHACGVATDLVIQNCIKNKAHFVCCPCCYGGIHDCYHLRYPRSQEFLDLNMTYKDYLNIAHAADQTHDTDNAKTKQGFFCMDVIDSDRKLQAESCDYVVHLGKLQPTSCTPKNNLLVGIYNK